MHTGITLTLNARNIQHIYTCLNGICPGAVHVFITSNTRALDHQAYTSDICIFLFQGQGPLWIASFNGRLNVVKTLLAGGANINQADKVG